MDHYLPSVYKQITTYLCVKWWINSQLYIYIYIRLEKKLDAILEIKKKTRAKYLNWQNNNELYTTLLFD
jgi:hypothetical protein